MYGLGRMEVNLSLALRPLAVFLTDQEHHLRLDCLEVGIGPVMASVEPHVQHRVRYPMAPSVTMIPMATIGLESQTKPL